MTDVTVLAAQLLIILVPGAALTAALFRPGQLPIPGMLALVFAFGIGAVGLVAWLLVTLSALSLASFITLIVIATAALCVVSFRAARPSARLRALRNEFGSQRWALALGILVVVAIAAVRMGATPLISLSADTPMRYWSDGLELADAGEVPETTLQWGSSYAPATSKMLFNCYTAAMSFIGGDQPLQSIAGLTWLAVVAMSLALWWLGWELGLRLTAPLLPLLTVGNSVLIRAELASDTRPYRAETLGRIFALCALALVVRALRKDMNRATYLIAGGLFALGASTHFVPTVVALGILFWYAVYSFFRSGRKRQHLVRLAGTLVVAALATVCIQLLPRGNLAFAGNTGSGSYSESLGGYDPTRFFAKGERVPLARTTQRAWYRPPEKMMRTFISSSTGLSLSSPWLWIGVALAGVAVLTLVAPDQVKPVGVVAAGLTVNIIAVTLFFDYVYGTFAQANFGTRRLFDYGTLPVWLVVLLLVEIGLWGAHKLRPYLAPAVAAILIVGLSVPLLPALERSEEVSPSFAYEIDELNWIRNNTPCDARILSNRRTGGTYQALTGRVAVSEGMGPFFRPGMLDRVNQFLIDMNAFFRAPAKHEDFLIVHGVDYVVLDRAGGWDQNLRTAPALPDRMARAPFLSLVYSGERANIYAVSAPPALVSLPDVSDHPGYVCRRGDIRV